MSYRGLCKVFLESCDISIGDIIHITNNNVEYTGMVLNRAAGMDDKHLVIKLDNGYNIGINIENADVELLEKGKKPKIELPKIDVKEDSNKKDI